jgi:hypothetical protein
MQLRIEYDRLSKYESFSKKSFHSYNLNRLCKTTVILIVMVSLNFRVASSQETLFSLRGVLSIPTF